MLYTAGLDLMTDPGARVREETKIAAAELCLNTFEKVLDFEGLNMLCHRSEHQLRARQPEAALKTIRDERIVVKPNTGNSPNVPRNSPAR